MAEGGVDPYMGVTLSFGGIPLLYYGDAVGMMNSLEYLDDPYRRSDNRWAHRYQFDWDKAEKRHETGTVEFVARFSEKGKPVEHHELDHPAGVEDAAVGP